MDYFGARYYGSALGRFTSPDEFKGGIVDPFTGQDIETNTALPYADITDPQTLNKYVYVRNNPLRYTDPNGHCIEDVCVVETVGATAIGGALLYYGYKLGIAIRDTLNSQYQPAPVYTASQTDQGQQAQPSPASGTKGEKVSVPSGPF